MEFGAYRESRKAAESEKAKAAAEVSNAKKMVKELTLRIDQSNRKAKSEKRDIEALKMLSLPKEAGENGKYVGVMRELEAVKQDLSKLKLDVALVLGEKSAAEKEIQDLGLKMEVNLKLVESLTNEIEVANEEHVLVELAKIEALKEYKEIEGEREEKGKEFLVSLEERTKKIKEMMEEVERSKEMENELCMTLSDVEMLETQLKLVKEMERRIRRSDDSLSRSTRALESANVNILVLKEITEEMEAKNEELSSINAEVFQLMRLMDALRNELIQTKEETARFENIVQKDYSKIEKLNSKLLKVKSKLKTVSAAEEKANSLDINLNGSLEKLKFDKETAKKEELRLKEEREILKAEIHKADIEMEKNETELLAMLTEVEKAKDSEALVLEKLESLIENTMERRASVSQKSSTITISRFEYEYLTGHASEAEKTAEKKVAAAEGWVEALKASTRAITMKTETLKRASGVKRTEEEKEGKKRIAEQEIQMYNQSPEADKFISAKPVRKSVRLSGKFTPTQRGKGRRLSSSRGTPTIFIIKKKKKKKVPNLVKFFRMKR